VASMGAIAGAHAGSRPVAVRVRRVAGQPCRRVPRGGGRRCPDPAGAAAAALRRSGIRWPQCRRRSGPGRSSTCLRWSGSSPPQSRWPPGRSAGERAGLWGGSSGAVIIHVHAGPAVAAPETGICAEGVPTTSLRSTTQGRFPMSGTCPARTESSPPEARAQIRVPERPIDPLGEIWEMISRFTALRTISGRREPTP
jgi:hypothetical protein